MDDLFKFIVGTATTGLTALAGWFGHTLFAYNDKIAHLDTRVTVLEKQEHVDPRDYVKAITEMAAAISSLVSTIAELKTEVQSLKRLLSERQGRGL